MDKYAVKLLTRAYQDLDSIYAYIAEILLETGTVTANPYCPHPRSDRLEVQGKGRIKAILKDY